MALPRRAPRCRITFLVHEGLLNDPVQFLLQLPRIWDGGIILYGSVIGGLISYAIGYYFEFGKAKLNTFQLMDIIAPSVALGLCFGRMGCFLNGCCYGQVACADCPIAGVCFPLSAPARERLVNNGYQTAAGFTLVKPHARSPEDLLDPDDLLFVGLVEPHSAAARAGLRPGDYIIAIGGQDKAARDRATVGGLATYLGRDWPRGQWTLHLTVMHQSDGVQQELSFAPWTMSLHPTQLYETISMFLLFLLLLAYSPFKTRNGQVMVLLMLGYAVHRYLNEKLRYDPRPEGFESYASVILFGAGVVLGVYLWLRPAEYQPKI